MNVDIPSSAPAFLLEQERTAVGDLATVVTLFLVNRRCPWHCVMCDLWKNTLPHDTPPGFVPAQIEHSLNSLPAVPQPTTVKLYNSGSFFDPRAIPPEDHPAIAAQLHSFERVIVECHPALIGDSALRFRDRLDRRTTFEIAMGLETVHPLVLPKLNKGMTLDQFAHAAEFLHEHGITLRVFILVKPPFLHESEAVFWSNRSVDFAIDHHASVVSLIPTRLGNEPLDRLAREGRFTPPKLATLEQAVDYGIGRRAIRVFADLWDLAKFSNCARCFEPRRKRLERMNHTQTLEPRVPCACGSEGDSNDRLPGP